MRRRSNCSRHDYDAFVRSASRVVRTSATLPKISPTTAPSTAIGPGFEWTNGITCHPFNGTERLQIPNPTALSPAATHVSRPSFSFVFHAPSNTNNGVKNTIMVTNQSAGGFVESSDCRQVTPGRYSAKLSVGIHFVN